MSLKLQLPDWLKQHYFVVHTACCHCYNASVVFLPLFISSRMRNPKFHLFLFLLTLSYLMCISDFLYAIAYQLLHFLGSLNHYEDLVAPRKHSYFSLKIQYVLKQITHILKSILNKAIILLERVSSLTEYHL